MVFVLGERERFRFVSGSVVVCITCKKHGRKEEKSSHAQAEIEIIRAVESSPRTHTRMHTHIRMHTLTTHIHIKTRYSILQVNKNRLCTTVQTKSIYL